MLFTIAIPTYNNSNTILKAINSCLNIEFEENEYEILIVNNASTDNTKEILKRITDSRVRIVENKKTVDLFENHNICFKEARGDYIVFCHSDDKVQRNILKILKRKLEERNYPEKYIIWGQSMFRDFYNFWGYFKINYNTIISGERAIKIFAIPNGLTPSGTCYSRKSIIEIGGFYKMKSRTTPSDWTIMLNAALNEFEFEMLDRLLFIRTYASTAVGITKKNRKQGIYDAFEEFKNKQSEENIIKVRNSLFQTSHVLGYKLLKKYYNITFKEKVKYLIKALIKNPKVLLQILLNKF